MNVMIMRHFNELNSFREQIIEIMEVITAYVDRLRIYEHVLNRVEYRFNEGELRLRLL